jgi:hypothetical protein
MKNYFNFLINTPLNLLALVLTWFTAIVIIIASYNNINTFEPLWYERTVSFMILIMFLSWLRSYLLYKRNI